MYPPGTGDVLAEYADCGGGVVVAMFGCSGQGVPGRYVRRHCPLHCCLLCCAVLCGWCCAALRNHVPVRDLSRCVTL
jgi:hypothetical protein